MPVITGISKLGSKDSEGAIKKLNGLIGSMRFVNELEQLTIASVCSVLQNAGINIPVGNNDIGIYMGIDDALEDLKDEHFINIIKEGILGSSPLLFPYTSPNALAAQASIAFDMRGETMTMPIKNSFKDVIEYATDCIIEKYTKMAVAGGIMKNKSRISPEKGRYCAEFYFLENIESAKERKAKIQMYLSDLLKSL